MNLKNFLKFYKKRKDLFINIKYGKHTRNEPETEIKDSLYVDLYLVFWPLFLRINEIGEYFYLIPYIFFGQNLVEKI